MSELTDMNATQAAVIPATEAHEYPLKFATKILIEGTPEAMRAYVELSPYDGEALMPNSAAGFGIDVLSVPNILPSGVSSESQALVVQTLQAFMMAGGDLKALTMAGIVLLVKQVAAERGIITP